MGCGRTQEGKEERMEEYRVNVSSVMDFYQCRFRWWCKWVKNRVPVATSPALDAGKLLHTIFEGHFKNPKLSLQQSAAIEIEEFRRGIWLEHPSAQPSLNEAITTIEDLYEAFPLWTEQYPVTESLEVEEAFEYQDPEIPWLIWLGRPDHVVVCANSIYHRQNRGLAAGMNFGTYIRLQKRSYHEHLYGEVLSKKYKRKKLKYGGTLFNLVRKLKFRTNVGKKNEKTKTAAEMFFQHPAQYSMQGGLHKAVMFAMRSHVMEMKEIIESGRIPAPNEKMNGGYGGNSEDPYFKVLINEISLDDAEVFKDREDTYAGRG